jgi:hypothetical protein
MWLSRRLQGQVNLVEPTRVVYGPTKELETIAKILKVPVARFVRAIHPQPTTAAEDETTSEAATDSVPAAAE